MKNEFARIVIMCLCTAAIMTSGLAGASDNNQQTPDTSIESRRNPIRLDDVVVRADRIPMTVMKIPAAATVLEIGYSEKSKHFSVGDLAGSLPGFRAYPAGNPWGRTQVDVRGFYGGGQAEYLVVTYAGIPMNNIASGQTPWTMVNLDDIGRLESIPGPVSAQYGDFGFGGLLAMYPPSSVDKRSLSLSMSAGSDRAWGFHLRGAAHSSSSAATVTLAKKRNEGWRRHSRFESHNAMVGVDKSIGQNTYVSALLAFGHSDEQFPGSLTDGELRHDRTASAVLSGIRCPDFARINDLRTGLSAGIKLGRNLELRPLAYFSYTSTGEVITITMPVRHEPRLYSAGGEMSLGLDKRLLNRALHIVVGCRGEYGELDSDYFTFDNTASSQTIIRKGDARRHVIAGYVHGLYNLHDNLFALAGLRIDNIGSEYTSSDGIQTHRESSFSPRFGVGADLRHGLTMYASIASAFKAPTLVHLYDAPPIYFELEPGTGGYFNIANNNLKAQTGICYEAGLKCLMGNQTSGRLSVYDYEISSEIDFDLSTSKYMNIGRSRHRGFELEAKQRINAQLQMRATMAYTSSTIRSGEFSGSQINGVPEIEYNAHVTYDISTWGFVTATIDGQGGQYLDQANSRKLGAHHLLGLSAGLSIWDIRIVASVHNLLDREYNYDGYVDLMNESRFYPAPGRSVFASVSWQF